ncbi:hypothetical protein IT407_01800 [Candidatus Uhrbacteria bacterium]|nr:hypothetical protein [Candidatus Uhrbacteria bacterium]
MDHLAEEETLPSLSELSAGYIAQPWLADAFDRFANHHQLYLRYAAMGLVLNRFMPEDARMRKEFVDNESEEPMSGPAGRVMAWLRTRSSRELRFVEKAASKEILRMSSLLDTLYRSDWPEHELLSLAVQREIFEAVFVLLRRRGMVSDLSHALAILDAEARKRLARGRGKGKEPVLHARHMPMLQSVHATGLRQWWSLHPV